MSERTWVRSSIPTKKKTKPLPLNTLSCVTDLSCMQPPPSHLLYSSVAFPWYIYSLEFIRVSVKWFMLQIMRSCSRRNKRAAKKAVEVILFDVVNGGCMVSYYYNGVIPWCYRIWSLARGRKARSNALKCSRKGNPCTDAFGVAHSKQDPDL